MPLPQRQRWVCWLSCITLLAPDSHVDLSFACHPTAHHRSLEGMPPLAPPHHPSCLITRPTPQGSNTARSTYRSHMHHLRRCKAPHSAITPNMPDIASFCTHLSAGLQCCATAPTLLLAVLVLECFAQASPHSLFSTADADVSCTHVRVQCKHPTGGGALQTTTGATTREQCMIGAVGKAGLQQQLAKVGRSD